MTSLDDVWDILNCFSQFYDSQIFEETCKQPSECTSSSEQACDRFAENNFQPAQDLQTSTDIPKLKDQKERVPGFRAELSCQNFQGASRESARRTCVKVSRRQRYKRQRNNANARERLRMSELNKAFDKLREILPIDAEKRKLSKYQVLTYAQNYIHSLTDTLLHDS